MTYAMTFVTYSALTRFVNFHQNTRCALTEQTNQARAKAAVAARIVKLNHHRQSQP
jgi:hypothetical protein